MDAILNSLPTIGCTSIIFLSIIVCLVWKPETVKKVIAKMVPVIAVLALLIYGYGYANRNTEEVIPPFVSIIRATMDVLRIFVGSNNWDTIKTAYPDNYQQAVFWLLHLAALFISASAVITSLGSRLIRRIRLRLLWMWDLSVICGLNEQTLEFGKELAQQACVPFFMWIRIRIRFMLPLWIIWVLFSGRMRKRWKPPRNFCGVSVSIRARKKSICMR